MKTNVPENWITKNDCGETVVTVPDNYKIYQNGIYEDENGCIISVNYVICDENNNMKYTLNTENYECCCHDNQLHKIFVE